MNLELNRRKNYQDNLRVI